jgi:uncharacterized membrane-anchored protein YjiN (DUF445 family)
MQEEAVNIEQGVPQLRLNTAADEQKRSDLARMRRIATGLLLLMTAIFVAALIGEQSYGWLRFVRATAEAAMVGAIADWFAVNALFRHPLGLKIPHTAIVPRRKDALGESLGRFVQQNFLTEDAVMARLRGLDTPRRLGTWLGDPAHTALVADYAMLIIAGAAQVARDDEVQDLIERGLIARVRETPVTPLVGKGLRLLLAGERQQDLLFGALQAAAYALQEHEGAIRQTISRAKPWWILVPIDDAVYSRLVNLVTGALRELEIDPNHPLHERFGELLERLVSNLEHDPSVIARGEEIKLELLAHPLVRETSQSIWQELKTELLGQPLRPESPLREAIGRGVGRLGTSLQSDPALQNKVENWLEGAVRYVVRSYGHEVQQLIAQTVRRWEASDMVDRLELQVGKELQFIRINGTVVGGLVGLLIAIFSWLVESWI